MAFDRPRPADRPAGQAAGSVFLLVCQQEDSSCGAVVHGEHVRPERPAIGTTALIHREDPDCRVAKAVVPSSVLTSPCRAASVDSSRQIQTNMVRGIYRP